MNLYTSDSKFFKILLYSFVFLGVISAASRAALIYTTETGPWTVQGYQRSQLEAAKSQAEVVFLGDSCIGNAVNDDYFTKISGLRTVNLGLSGLYGFAGPYQMLKEAHKLNPDLKIAVIVPTVDMFTRPVSYEGYIRTVFLNSEWSLGGLYQDFHANSKIAMEFTKYFITSTFDIRNLSRSLRELKLTYSGGREADQRTRKHDFFGREEKLDDPDTSVKIFPASSVNPDKAFFLSKIADYCSEHGIKCVYMSAPYYQGAIEANKEYMAAASKIAEDAIKDRMLYLGTPWPVPKSEVGNVLDHIYYQEKNKYTEEAYKRLVRGKVL